MERKESVILGSAKRNLESSKRMIERKENAMQESAKRMMERKESAILDSAKRKMERKESSKQFKSLIEKVNKNAFVLQVPPLEKIEEYACEKTPYEQMPGRFNQAFSLKPVVKVSDEYNVFKKQEQLTPRKTTEDLPSKPWSPKRPVNTSSRIFDFETEDKEESKIEKKLGKIVWWVDNKYQKKIWLDSY